MSPGVRWLGLFGGASRLQEVAHGDREAVSVIDLRVARPIVR